MFSVNPRATLGRIFISILIQKSEKQLKVLRVCLVPRVIRLSFGAVPLRKV